MAPNGFQENVKPSQYMPVEKETTDNGILKAQEQTQVSKRQPLKYKNIVMISLIHVYAILGLIYSFMYMVWPTFFFNLFYTVPGGLGVTAGVHRLWTHRTYTAKLPARIILAMFYSIAGQNTIPEWVLDHRVHHRYSETDADPHNSNRGFFFAHVGWLLQKKHPEVIKKGKQIDMSDVNDDPVVYYHTKAFVPLYFIFVYIIPVTICCNCFGESFSVAMAASTVRYVLLLNGTWSVNSAAHMFGYRPFSTRIQPVENKFVSVITMGEGWHNYHHVFPWDYKAAEWGSWRYNFSAIFIETLAKLGLVYDLKAPSPDLVERVAQRFGDGTPRFLKPDHPQEVDQEGNVVNYNYNEPDIVVPWQVSGKEY